MAVRAKNDALELLADEMQSTRAAVVALRDAVPDTNDDSHSTHSRRNLQSSRRDRVTSRNVAANTPQALGLSRRITRTTREIAAAR